MQHPLTRRRFLTLSSAALAGMAAAQIPVAAQAGRSGIWQPAAPLLVARIWHTATLLRDGRVLVVGGSLRAPDALVNDGFDTAQSAIEVYDPSADTWTRGQSLRDRRVDHTATLLEDGRVLVVGGDVENGKMSQPLGTAEIYDPVRDTWVSVPSLMKPDRNTATRLRDGRVLVVHGGTAEVYDPAANRWAAAGSLTVARSATTATLMPSGRVLATGGLGGQYRDGADANCDVYIPEQNRWVAVAPLKERRFSHTATLLPDGSVLVAGGDQATSAGGGPSETETLRGATGWSLTAALTSMRNRHAAVLLRDGRVLFVGGARGLSDYLPGTELYDPVTNHATAGPPLSMGRTGHTATLLNNGTVLVVGGRSEDSLSLNDAVRYDPDAP